MFFVFKKAHNRERNFLLLETENLETDELQLIQVYCQYEQISRITTCNLPSPLCQTGLLGRTSYACVIIALEMARIIDQFGLTFPRWKREPTLEEKEQKKIGTLVRALILAMLKGNQIYLNAVNDGKLVQPEKCGLCIPQGNRFEEISYVSRVIGYVYENLPVYLRCAMKRIKTCQSLSQIPNLYFMVIVERVAALLVYQPAKEVIGIVDSHSHSSFGMFLLHFVDILGAILAYTHEDNLLNLCRWMVFRIFHETLKLCETKQLSLLVYRKGYRMSYCKDVFPKSIIQGPRRSCECHSN